MAHQGERRPDDAFRVKQEIGGFGSMTGCSSQRHSKDISSRIAMHKAEVTQLEPSGA
jgi:hypothetical protein